MARNPAISEARQEDSLLLARQLARNENLRKYREKYFKEWKAKGRNEVNQELVRLRAKVESLGGFGDGDMANESWRIAALQSLSDELGG